MLITHRFDLIFGPPFPSKCASSIMPAIKIKPAGTLHRQSPAVSGSQRKWGLDRGSGPTLCLHTARLACQHEWTSFLDPPFRVNLPQVQCLPSKSSLPEFFSGSHPQSAAVSGSQRQSPEMGFGPRLGTHPSTRAGDQDDVSSEQTPSN